MLAGGAITFLFSFLSFVEASGDGRNAWSGDVFALFPNTTVIALFGLATVVVILVTWLANPNLPKVLTFDWKQILFAWGATSALFMLCYLITEKAGGEFGAGGILMLLGSLVMAVGATLNLLGIATSPISGGAGARSSVAGGFPGQAGGYPGQPGVSQPSTQPGYAPAPPSAPTPPPPPPPASGGSTPPPPPPPI